MIQKAGQPKGFSFLRVIGVTAALLMLVALLLPAIGCGIPAVRVQARNDVAQLLTAIKAYSTEYGHLPLANHHSFCDELSQARLLRVLQGLDANENPRRVVFFEGRQAVPQRRWWFQPCKYRAGLHPTSGALLDPWGQPYRILLGADRDGNLQSPYRDNEEIHTSVLIWSLGKDGVQGSPGTKNVLKDSDDIVSWH